MSPPLWHREASTIPPWPGAKAIGPDGASLRVVSLSNSLVWTVEDSAVNCGTGVGVGWSPWHVVNLEDPDTLAAFDRRLALRLGASEEDAREGVQVSYYDDTITPCWWVHFGRRGAYYDAEDLGGKPDPILARVRAWNNAEKACNPSAPDLGKR